MADRKKETDRNSKAISENESTVRGDKTAALGKAKAEIGIREIASLAGVSTATVSRVMNHPEKCREETRRKVERIIAEYDYVPNDNIRNIFSKTSNTIALFIHDINNPFYSQLIRAVNSRCLAEKYTLLICDTENDLDREKTYLEFCRAKRVMGIIVTEGVSNDLFKDVDIPVVALDRGKFGSSYVSSECYESVRHAIGYLYNLGHRNIAFVGPSSELFSVELRMNGYRDEMKARSLDVPKELIYLSGSSLSSQLGKEALNYFLTLEKPPTAIFCANDMIALGVINEARLLGISIPKDLSVCGFDHVLDDFSYLPLTTVEQDIPAIAEEFMRILKKSSGKEVHTVIPARFVTGRTCTKVKNG